MHGERLVKNGVTFAGQPHKRTSKQALDLDVRRKLVGGADGQVDTPLVQRLIIGKALRHDPQGCLGHFLGHALAQRFAVHTEKHIVGADAERALQRAQIAVLALGEHPVRQFHHAADLLAQLQRSGGWYQPTPGTHQNGVIQHFADTRQGAAHGRSTEVHAPGSARHRALFEQDIEGNQQIQVRYLHGRKVIV